MEEVCSHASGLLSSRLWPVATCPISFLQVKYQDKDVIVREGAEGNTFYIILKGEVSLFDIPRYALWTFLLPLCVFL